VAAELRHGLEVLWPSELADQYYCEYKVHLKHTHPEVEVESPALEVGTAGHEGLASVAQPISRAEIAEAIRTGKRLALCEWTLEGEVEQVRLRGRPDYLAFEGTNAELVLEFKFARFQRPFRSQEVQAAVYGLLAEKMGFSCEGLCYGIVRLPPQPRAAHATSPNGRKRCCGSSTSAAPCSTSTPVARKAGGGCWQAVCND